MQGKIVIGKQSFVKGTVPSLPSSKSLSNRALIIGALAGGADLQNLSTARDTRLMMALVASPDHVIDVRDAGTTMRFLTAYFAITGQRKTITGTDRMKERPIFPLVDALRELGAAVRYLDKEGFPPLELEGFDSQRTNRISIRGDISSQFISALMMVAPRLPQGLTLQLTGKVGSWPYLKMTAALMEQFGVRPVITGDSIAIPHAKYSPAHYRVEPDWSAASYWFAMAALGENTDILLPGVAREALQGDKVIVDIMEKLGVRSQFGAEGLRLTRGLPVVELLSWDFTDCPDLAQTVLPVCSALGVHGKFTGMESLRIKETDRIAALQNELAKIGAKLTEDGNRWELIPGRLPDRVSVATYHDHRMAMGFAPLATRMEVEIEDPEVVNKSYPSFWEDLKAVGIEGR